MKKVFIDGSAGTTGLRIYERLEKRKDIQLISLSEEERKNPISRKKAINESDVTFLCLPDDASRESVSFLENENTVVIDTSTAHRTEEGWLYGFPEIDKDFDKKVKTAKKIAVPGCHASGFIALVQPLIQKGILPKEAYLTCTSVTGYSGGGKKMIAEYNSQDKSELLDYPRQYALGQTHKHLKEMAYVTKLENPPIFMPIVGDFYSGMQVSVPVFKKDLMDGKTIQDIIDVYKSIYNGKLTFYKQNDENGFMSSGTYAGKDCMEISVYGNQDRIVLQARYDNLGKGASGAAIQCLNYVLGVKPETDLAY